MPKIPEELLVELLGSAQRARPDAARFNQDAYRIASAQVPGREERQHRWWFTQPEQAKTFGESAKIQETEPLTYADTVATFPGKLDTSGFIEIDYNGRPWGAIPVNELPVSIGSSPRFQGRGLVSTDTIAAYVDDNNLPGVIFRNVLEEGGTVGDQIYVGDLSRRRGRFAKYEDPNSSDLMASTLLSLLGGGAAAGLAGQKRKDET